MNQDQLYSYVVRILKQLEIPFSDPCDANYTGQCICTEGMGTWVNEQPVFTPGTSTFNLSSVPQSTASMFVFIGGQKIPNANIIMTGAMGLISGYTFNANDELEVHYLTSV